MYTLTIDNTDYTAALAAQVPIRIRRGLPPLAAVADTGRMQLSLHATSGATPVVPPLGGLAQLALNGTPLFTGTVDRVTTEDRLVRVEVVDTVAALKRTPLDTFPLVLDATPRELIKALYDRAAIPPAARDRFRLDAVGLGAPLADTFTGLDFDTGLSVFPWAGDTWSGRVYSALEEVCRSEGGMFYVAADGTGVFRDREHRDQHITLAATVETGIVAIERGRLINRVSGAIYPREVGTPGEVLWKASTNLYVEAGDTREITVTYTDPDTRVVSVGGLDVIAPVAVTDYQAEDNLGINLTSSIDVQADIGASSAVLHITNNAGVRATLTLMQIRGTPLRRFRTIAGVTRDRASQIAYGTHPYRLETRLQADPDVVRELGNSLLEWLDEPTPWPTVTVGAAFAAVDVNDRISLGTRLSDQLFVDRIHHHIRLAAGEHRLTWFTSPAPTQVQYE